MAKITQHTPGPWQVGIDYIVRSSGGKCIAVMGDPNFPARTDDVKNAVLVAAAPELLAACKQASDESPCYCEDEVRFRPAERCAICVIRAAIAKSIGQSVATPVQ
jgi:hypothetical protein